MSHDWTLVIDDNGKLFRDQRRCRKCLFEQRKDQLVIGERYSGFVWRPVADGSCTPKPGESQEEGQGGEQEEEQISNCVSSMGLSPLVAGLR